MVTLYVHDMAECGVPGEEGREEADGEGGGERRHQQHRQDQPLPRSYPPLAARRGSGLC